MNEGREVMTTTDCARALGMTGEFIRGEIKEGRLLARVFRGSRRRAKYRIERADFDSYKREYWPKAG